MKQDKTIYFDSDVLSSFFTINRFDILYSMYGQKIIISKEVALELNRVGYIKKELEILRCTTNVCFFQNYTPCTKYLLAELNKTIGLGESSVLALASCSQEGKGIIASNNLSDVFKYVRKYNLKNLTTADILYAAYNTKIISLQEGNKIWNQMTKKHQRIGHYTNLSNYIIKKRLDFLPEDVSKGEKDKYPIANNTISPNTLLA